MSLSGPITLVHRTLSPVANEPVIIQPAFYPYNDTSLPQAERDYLKTLADRAATQNLAENEQAYLRWVSIAFTIFATFMVGLRFCARWRQKARILIDDWFIVAALALLYGNTAMNLLFAAHGMGLHSGRLPLEELTFLLRNMIGAELIYVTSVTFYKIALLLFYYRVFPVPQVRRWGLICGGLTLGWGLACVTAACLQCVPLHKAWEPWAHGGCINLFLTQLCISVPSTLCDVAILCLPIPSVMALQMNRGQRVLVLATFLLGGYVVFTSIYRFVLFLGYRPDDQPYTLSPGLAWNVVEVSSGIVGTCLPTLGPIVRMLWRNLIPSTVRSAMRSVSKGLSAIEVNSRSAGDATGSGSRSQGGGGGGGGGGSGSGPATQRWEKLQEAKTPRGEEAKYGIGLATMYENNYSDEVLELVVQRQVDVQVSSVPAGAGADPDAVTPVGTSVTISGPPDARPAKHLRRASSNESDEWPLAPRLAVLPPPQAKIGRMPSTRR
ncbi:hypothetical protein P8C59_007925 [Phyllachora maydis]|uniref:Rhodopsin domain-containing protein n=1 Tax=Phyllachora maydis TaxID=1825666 RepID=A0AAD9IB79_9PEZI|nr:hypothetical protein P8C59_007925 [Phyllachora maydis]